MTMSNRERSSTVSRLPASLHWAQISGIDTTMDSSSESILHYTPHLWYAKDGPVGECIQVVLGKNVSPRKQMWPAALTESIARFGRENKIDDNVFARIWGFATSPLNDHVTLCFTLHPSDMVQYTMSSDMEHHMLIVAENDALPSPPIVNGSSSESVLFAVSRWIARQSPLQAEHVVQLEQWMQACKSAQRSTSQYMASTLQQQIDTHTAFKSLMLDATRPFVNQAQDVGRADDMFDDLQTSIALSSAVLKLSTQTSALQELDRRIICNHQRWMQLMAKTGAMIDVDVQELAGEEVSTNTAGEICTICSELIAFEDDSWARCAQGHQFGELSFLSFQEFSGLTEQSAAVCRSSQYRFPRHQNPAVYAIVNTSGLRVFDTGLI